MAVEAVAGVTTIRVHDSHAERAGNFFECIKYVRSDWQCRSKIKRLRENIYAKGTINIH